MGKFVHNGAGLSPAKTCRRHRCSRRHREHRTLAKCMWPRACWITGEGESAVLAHCDVLTVTLWPDRSLAEHAKAVVDRSACGGKCYGKHEIVRLALDGAA